MTSAADFDLRPLTVPSTIDASDATDFIAMVDVRNEIYREISANDDEAVTPAQLLPHFQHDPDNDKRSWIVLVGGEVVGRVIVDLPAEEGSQVAYWTVELLERVQGRGIGGALHAVVEGTAREAGRTVLQSWAEHTETSPGDATERLAAPTGYGEIPLDRPARYYRRHGHTLEQVDRKSVLEIEPALPTVRDLLADAESHADGYHVEQWTLPTPEAYRESFAWAKSRMSTDAPSAGLEIDEETWDVERLARHDARFVEGGQTVLVTVAVHETTGAVVAFNELCSGVDPSAATQQMDTLVLREHRGHRLGQLVKCAGILRWRELMPQSSRIVTWNAEENRPMLSINETVGFVPAAYIGAWKKVLA
ncbi:GNAT family N-acetyltransferase [Microbacterium sp. NPDC077663]|uniref:GNAT family N-acetyltransferase n=1 Tax=Microbacterium sp. NPDC077663 TaxID=3364189 RepID=UPI0037CA87BF